MSENKPPLLERTPVSIAVQALEKTKRELTERYKRDMEELDRAIANVKKLPTGKKAVTGAGKSKLNGEVSGMLGRSWEGMGIPDAVHAFLSNFDSPVPFKELMHGLQARGVRLGDPLKPNRFAANVKTTVINNRKRFKYDRRRDTVKLLREAAAAAA